MRCTVIKTRERDIFNQLFVLPCRYLEPTREHVTLKVTSTQYKIDTIITARTLTQSHEKSLPII